MFPLSRVTDVGIGFCTCHIIPPVIPMTGMVMSGSFTTNSDVLPNARLMDIVVGFCGHVGVLVTGSPITNADALPMCKTGDTFVGCFFGNLVSGSFTTFSI